MTKARGLRLAAQVLGNGLLTSEPPVHARQRQLVRPAFHHRRLRAYGRETVALTAEADRWTAGAPFDAAAAANRLALATVARRWRLRLAALVPPPHGSVTLRPSGPVQMIAEPR